MISKWSNFHDCQCPPAGRVVPVKYAFEVGS
ncbi:hypothetical protein BPC006_II0195 [Burkholderia pseudomallei BPC006]|nr:hypothetical protein BPC006_II0195 [Burkholderia pseudomallei BPC006]